MRLGCLARIRLVTTFLWIFLTSTLIAEDLIEFLNGSKARGTVVKIDKSKRILMFEAKIGDKSYQRTYPYSRIHAVTYRGKRYVLNKKTTASSSSKGRMTRSQVMAHVETVGGSPPQWYASTPLDYPKTLDLSWPEKPPKKGWNNQVNMGQYMWDIINPNPRRWPSAVKLIHHIMEGHKSDPKLLKRDMKALAGVYFRLFQDYPRAAFWLQKVRVAKGSPDGIMLAECYFRMGNKAMALDMITKRPNALQAIKLLGDMGETNRATNLGDLYGKNSNAPHQAYLLAGDACRVKNQFSKAIAYYRKVLSAGQARNKDYQKRFEARARESIEAIELFENLDLAQVSDGTYQASSTGYNGALEVEVVVADSKIQDVKVVRHREKQFYAALTDTTNQIKQKQSVKGIDATSSATITSQAIVNAAAKALAKGK